MAVELYLNGEKVDLSEGQPIALTKQVVDLKSFDSIKGDHTNSFTIPMTDRNKRVLENIHRIYTISDLPNRKIPAQIVQDGLEVLIGGGYAIIDEAGDKFRVAVYSGNISWAAAIEGKKISDLNYFDDMHEWDITEIQASHNTPGLNYLYPKVDYTDGTAVVFDEERIRPWVYAKSILRKIFEEAGYQVEGVIFNDPRFDGLHIECSKLEYPEQLMLAEADVNEAGGSIDIIEDPGAGTESYLRFPREINDPLETYDPPGVITEVNPGGGPRFEYTYARTGWYEWEMLITVDHVSAVMGVTNYPPGSFIRYVIYSSTTPFGWPATYIPVILTPGQPRLIKFTTYATAGDKEYFYLKPQPDFFEPGSNEWHARVRNESYIRVRSSTYGATEYGDIINPGLMLPDLDQREFIKAMSFMFGCVPVPSPTENKVTFRSWNELQDRKQYAYDWTDKLDTNQVQSHKFRLDGWAKNNRFRYADTDTAPKGFGDGVIETDDDWAAFQRDVIVLPFAATVTGQGGTPHIPRLEQDDLGNYTIWGGDSPPRIMTLVEETSGSFFGQNPWKRSFFRGILGEQLNLAFRDRLLDDYYDFLLSMLDNPRPCEKYVKLSANDFYNFDYFTPVFFAQDQAYYFVNKIGNWVDGKSTKVELIRI